MRVLVFGASGMVGQAALTAAVRDPEVTEVVAVVRRPLGTRGADDPKVRQVQHTDFADVSALHDEFAGTDLVLYCLGTTSVGKSEAEYTVTAHDYPVAAARALAAAHPGAGFVLVTGAGSDTTEKGRVMWARVRGRAENAIAALDLKAHMFRPGFILAPPGVESRTPVYRALYKVARALHPLMQRTVPDKVTTSERLGRAMLAAARDLHAPVAVEVPDINRLGA